MNAILATTALLLGHPPKPPVPRWGPPPRVSPRRYTEEQIAAAIIDALSPDLEPPIIRRLILGVRVRLRHPRPV